MNNIAFVLWVCLWVIASEVSDYYIAKRKAITGEPQMSEEDKRFTFWFEFILWIVVAILLYRPN